MTNERESWWRERRMGGRALLTLAFLLPAALAAGCGQPPAEAEMTATGDAIARGRYLVTVGGCNDCHTPWVLGEDGHPAPDRSRMLSGHPQNLEMPPAPAAAGPWIWSGAATNTAFAGPWGVSFATNLTPDENTGIGVWDEEIFVDAMRTGRHWGQSRPILPPMPWQNLAAMTDEDLAAMFAYLRSIPPIENRVPEPLPPAAGGAEAGMVGSPSP
ncbi:MAG: diheme cytochrome c-553 [Acidobacteriota bacterium]